MTIMILTALTVSAQGEWTKTQFDGDELTGVSAYTAYTYSEEGKGSYVSWGWDDPHFRLITEKGIFSESVCYAWFGQYRAVRVLVGIYDGQRNLKEKFYVDMYQEKTSRGNRISLSSMKSERKKAKKIAKALTSDRGIVRFVCARYSRSNFDLWVPYFR